MSPRSKVTRLPAPVRAEIDRLIRDGATLDELVGHLKSFGLPSDKVPARSSVHRYRAQFEKALAERDAPLSRRIEVLDGKLAELRDELRALARVVNEIAELARGTP
jgi:hypothetical protein